MSLYPTSGTGSKCSVANCQNYAVQRNSLSQFRFPRDQELCGKWVERCGSLRMQERFNNFGSDRLYYVNKICSKHFAITDFRNPKLPAQGLVKGAVPSLHVFPPGEVETPPPKKTPVGRKKKNKPTTSKRKKSTSSSKDNPNDEKSPKNIGSNASAHGQPLTLDPAVSAPGGTTTARRSLRVPKRTGIQQLTPISVRTSKTGMVTSTELPDKLKTCASLNCKSRTDRMPHLKFYHFPVSNNRAKLWAVNCSRPDLLDIDSQRLHIDYVLCSLHFEKHYFSDNLTLSIKQHAIPTLFDLNESPEASSSCVDSSKDITSEGLFDENSSEYIADDYQQDNAQEMVYADKNSSHSTETCPLQSSVKHTATQTDPPWITTKTPQDKTKSALCRLCATLMPHSQMVHIFEKLSASKQYLRKINQLLPSSEQVAEYDSLPQWICYNCCRILDYCNKAEQGFLAANRKLREMFGNPTPVTKKNDVPLDNNKPNSKLMGQDNQDFVTDEVIIMECDPLKEEVIELEDFDEGHQYDTSSEQDYIIDEMQQLESDSVKDINIPTKRKHIQAQSNVQSATSAKLLKTEDEVFGVKGNNKTTNNLSLSKKQSLPKAKEHEETVIQNSHTTILTSLDKKTFFCERCDMSFVSIETALTHRFKLHSSEEFSEQVQK